MARKYYHRHDYGVYFDSLFTGNIPEVNVPIRPFMIVLGGMVVGLGASFRSGCTSGRGALGLSRLSPRSLVAVPTFMTTGVITLHIIRQVLEG